MVVLLFGLRVENGTSCDGPRGGKILGFSLRCCRDFPNSLREQSRSPYRIADRPPQPSLTNKKGPTANAIGPNRLRQTSIPGGWMRQSCPGSSSGGDHDSEPQAQMLQ